MGTINSLDHISQPFPSNQLVVFMVSPFWLDESLKSYTSNATFPLKPAPGLTCINTEF